MKLMNPPKPWILQHENKIKLNLNYASWFDEKIKGRIYGYIVVKAQKIKGSSVSLCRKKWL